MTRTVPVCASSMAARIPATPAPITRKSQSIAKVNFSNAVEGQGYRSSIDLPNTRYHFFRYTAFHIMTDNVIERWNARFRTNRSLGVPHLLLVQNNRPLRKRRSCRFLWRRASRPVRSMQDAVAVFELSPVAVIR
jgi:hypothetical protein